MPDKKKDTFLESLTGVKPLKKSNKNFKPISVFYNEETTKNKKNIEKKTIKIGENTQSNNKLQARLKIQRSPLDKKLKKGKISINKKIDLHGLSVDQAKKIFIDTIEGCYHSNKRCILFVTGKGNKKNNSDIGGEKLYYGKIRNEFLSWVKEQRIEPKILNVTNAGLSHGGDGAFFVYLRKKKPIF